MVHHIIQGGKKVLGEKKSVNLNNFKNYLYPIYETTFYAYSLLLPQDTHESVLNNIDFPL